MTSNKWTKCTRENRNTTLTGDIESELPKLQEDDPVIVRTGKHTTSGTVTSLLDSPRLSVPSEHPYRRDKEKPPTYGKS